MSSAALVIIRAGTAGPHVVAHLRATRFEGHLLAVETLTRPADPMVARRLLASGASLTSDQPI